MADNYCKQYFPDVSYCREPEPVASETDLRQVEVQVEYAIMQSTYNISFDRMKMLMETYLLNAMSFLHHAKDYQELVNNEDMIGYINTAITALSTIIGNVHNAVDIPALQEIGKGPLYAYMGVVGGLIKKLLSYGEDGNDALA